MEATLYNGSPTAMIDYTPNAAVAAGKVVLLGGMPTIALRDIAANEKGAVAAGGAVYTLTAELAIAVGDLVYWDDTNKKVDKTNTNKQFGYAVTAAAADGDAIKVLHWPA